METPAVKGGHTDDCERYAETRAQYHNKSGMLWGKEGKGFQRLDFD